MRRRFQFSLRTLLGLAAVVCLLLGGWHLLETYGSYIEAEPLRVGVPVKLRGRYVCFFGPNKVPITIGYEKNSDEVYGWSAIVGSERSWLCLYNVECELEPVDEPCEITIYLQRDPFFPGRGFPGGRIIPIKSQVERVYADDTQPATAVHATESGDDQ
jgi:hypothetical protein